MPRLKVCRHEVQPRSVLSLPRGAQLLDVESDGESLFVAALVDVDELVEQDRKVLVLAEDEEVERAELGRWRYLGQAMVGDRSFYALELLGK